MNSAERYLVFLKDYIIKNREIVIFIIASVAFLMLYPESRRFPYEWKQQSRWVHPDLQAEFSFTRPISDKEINDPEDSTLQSFYYFSLQSLKPEIHYASIDSVSNEILLKKIFNTSSKKYLSKLISDIETDRSESADYGCFIVEASDTFAVSCTDIYDIKFVKRQIKKQIHSAFLAQGLAIPNVEISVSPNLRFIDRIYKPPFKNLSDDRRFEVIDKGFTIVRKNQVIDQITHQRLTYYKKLYSTGYPNGLNTYKILAGKWILVLIILFMLYQFLVSFRPNVLEDSSKLFMILSIMFFFFAIVMKVVEYQESWIYFIPLPIVPIVLKAFYDTRLALFCHFLLLLLISPAISDFFTFFILHFSSGVFSIITVESIYKRSQLFTSVFKIIAVYFIVFFAVQLTSGTSLPPYPQTYIKLTVNAFLILLAFPIIYSVEKIFGMVSDLSLLELSDTNMPLLKELAEKAPGTFQHSLQVSSLAESAAAKIGANTLLTRTAALYHDIGKMIHPQFFVENQITGYNPHDELSFEESARVIIDHVKEGVKLARERKLPESIIDFIRTHHGTTTVLYFYKMYLKKHPENTDAEKRFRYSGPTPFSKETAILMLADSVEASCRSLAQHGADRFQMEAQIDAIFESLMDQRQFDNANISLAEIYEVKKTLKKKITNIYHNRIQYPK